MNYQTFDELAEFARQRAVRSATAPGPPGMGVLGRNQPLGRADAWH
jgi:hypothetical protein